MNDSEQEAIDFRDSSGGDYGLSQHIRWIETMQEVASWGQPKLPDTNAADMARCVSRLRAHLKPKHLLTWWIFANMIGAGIYLAQLASMHFGVSQ